MARSIQAIEVFVKDQCSLCDDMVAGLKNLQKVWRQSLPFSIQLNDIEDRQDWYARYREYVPVVVVNGEEICHYFLEQDELEKALQ